MDKTEFLTIYPTFMNLDVVKQTLPSVIEETKRCNARLIVHDCSMDAQPEKLTYLQELNRENDFFLLASNNMSAAHSRNLCLKVGKELYAPDYICIMEDDHGYKPGVIDQLIQSMQQYYGKQSPNGLKYGMFTACRIHSNANIIDIDHQHGYPSAESDPFSVGGANNCFRCAPTSHWDHVLKDYDTDEYLLSEYQTAGPRWRNYRKGFTVMFVGGGDAMFEVECVGRGMTGDSGLRLWDNDYCASDSRSRYKGKPGMPTNAAVIKPVKIRSLVGRARKLLGKFKKG